MSYMSDPQYEKNESGIEASEFQVLLKTCNVLVKGNLRIWDPFMWDVCHVEGKIIDFMHAFLKKVYKLGSWTSECM